MGQHQIRSPGRLRSSSRRTQRRLGTILPASSGGACPLFRGSLGARSRGLADNSTKPPHVGEGAARGGPGRTVSARSGQVGRHGVVARGGGRVGSPAVASGSTTRSVLTAAWATGPRRSSRRSVLLPFRSLRSLHSSSTLRNPLPNPNSHNAWYKNWGQVIQRER